MRPRCDLIGAPKFERKTAVPRMLEPVARMVVAHTPRPAPTPRTRRRIDIHQQRLQYKYRN